MIEALETTIKDEDTETTTYGLTLNVTIGPEDSVEEQYNRMVDSLYEWVEIRGDVATELSFTFIAPPDQHENILSYCIGLVQLEEPLHDFFLKVGSVTVGFAGGEGEGFREVVIECADLNEAEAD